MTNGTVATLTGCMARLNHQIENDPAFDRDGRMTRTIADIHRAVTATDAPISDGDRTAIERACGEIDVIIVQRRRSRKFVATLWAVVVGFAICGGGVIVLNLLGVLPL